MNRREQDAFSERIGRQLRDSEDSLDELTLARLRAARVRAVEAARPARPKLLALGGFVSATAVLLLALGVWWMQPPGEQAAPPLEDVHLLSAGEDLQLLEELDFYMWLEYGQQELG